MQASTALLWPSSGAAPRPASTGVPRLRDRGDPLEDAQLGNWSGWLVPSGTRPRRPRATGLWFIAFAAAYAPECVGAIAIRRGIGHQSNRRFGHPVCRQAGVMDVPPLGTHVEPGRRDGAEQAQPGQADGQQASATVQRTREALARTCLE
jgi:hypothetical protein